MAFRWDISLFFFFCFFFFNMSIFKILLASWVRRDTLESQKQDTKYIDDIARVTHVHMSNIIAERVRIRLLVSIKQST